MWLPAWILVFALAVTPGIGCTDSNGPGGFGGEGGQGGSAGTAGVDGRGGSGGRGGSAGVGGAAGHGGVGGQAGAAGTGGVAGHGGDGGEGGEGGAGGAAGQGGFAGTGGMGCISSGSLRFVEAVPMPPLADVQASAVAVSPDGSHVYVTAGNGDGLVAYQRDASTGKLARIQTIVDDLDGVDGLQITSSVTVSPDGAHVYATSAGESAIAAFSRDAGSGLLTFVEAEFEGVAGVEGLAAAHEAAVSPDGAHVYVASPGRESSMPPDPGRISLFVRDASSGALTFADVITDDVGGITGLNGVSSVTVSPDGAHAYTTAFPDDAVAVFERNETTGALQLVEVQLDGVAGVDGLDGATEATVSPDGAHLYSVSIAKGGRGENALVTFERDRGTGELHFANVRLGVVGEVDGLRQPSSVSLESGGNWLMVTGLSADALSLYRRDTTTGVLSLEEIKTDGEDCVDGLDAPVRSAVSPDGVHVYVAALLGARVVVFEVPAP